MKIELKKIIKTIHKTLAVMLVASLILAYSLPLSVLAQEVTADPTPTPTQTEITNDATGNNITDTNANTGDNTIGEPTPTPTPAATEEQATPTPSPEPTPTSEDTSVTSDQPLTTEGGVEATNSATLTNDVSSTADSGNNAISEPSPTPGSESQGTEGSEPSSSSAAITTGNAVAVTTVENEINSTAINSEVIFQTINIFVDQEGDIDLSNPAALIEGLIRAFPEQAEINVALTQITNTASLTNTVSSSANTGNNEIYGGQEGSITTGDAYSLISLLNRVNFVMVDSKLHVVTINIFGNLVGNIILPDIETPPDTPPCEECNPVSLDNQATVQNSVDSQAVSGQNEIVDAQQAEISTGTAVSVVQLTNFVNVNFINGSIWQLWIIPFGVWEGSFVGWGPLGSQPGGRLNLIQTDNGGSESPCDTCVGELTIGNSANVTNTVSSTANSGGNLVQGAENASIGTGRATSLVSLLNFVNSNFIRSRGFFGFINIFGRWSGNIGGASFFAVEEEPAEEESTPVIEAQSQTPTDAPYVRESGGKLEISQSNNVGEYVLPGDTVTFFIKVKNPGTGRVYDATLDLRLIKDGKDMGGVNFSLGTIEPERGVKVTTGLVLSQQTPGGNYTAHATVRGVTGPENSLLEVSADSQFLVFGNTAIANTEESPLTPETSQILGTTYPAVQQQANILHALLVLLLLVPAYTTLRAVKERKQLALLFMRELQWRERLRALQLFLL